MAKAKDKACKICKIIYETGEKCPSCGSKEYTDSYKGRTFILDPEKSDIAKNLNIKEKGNFAIKTK
jgi:DNA-directed RNA polymerase subunit E"